MSSASSSRLRPESTLCGSVFAGWSQQSHIGAARGEEPRRRATHACRSSCPWWQTDDVFYEGRGATWALLGLTRGLEVDFHDVLVDKNALSTFRNLEHTLAASQRPMESPMVLSGGGFGIVPNHDLGLAAYVSSAVNIARSLETLMRKD